MQKVFLLWVEKNLIGVFSSEAKAFEYADRERGSGAWTAFERWAARVEEWPID